MKIIGRFVFALAGATVFFLSFLIGLGPRLPVAHAGPPADSDSDSPAADESLPHDVRSRLQHIYPAATTQDFRPAVTFWEVLGKIKTRYVDKITDQDKLSRGAVTNMLRSLHDPFSRILSPAELALDRQQDEGNFNGMGLVLGGRLSGEQAPIEDAPGREAGPPHREAEPADRAWQLVVLDTLPGGPAANAGLQTGDIISKIDDVRIDQKKWADKSIDDLNLLFNGPDAGKVKLTVIRPGNNQALDVSLTNPAAVTTPPVDGRMLPSGAAYLRVRLFTPRSGTQIAHTLVELSAQHPTSLMLDLRDNPGGDLAAAVNLIGSLTPAGPAGVLDSHGGERKLDPPAGLTHYSFAHIVVLVNRGTANVAELSAAALHERDRAILAGAPTFGNGLIQTIYPLKDGWAYALTTGRLRTPAGADFNQHGLAVQRPIDSHQLSGDGAISAATPLLVAAR